MRKATTLSVLLLFSLFSVALSSPLKLEAYLSKSTFNIPGESPFLETYLQINGNSIVYKANNTGKFQGSVQVTIIIRKDSSIVDFRKYELISPEIADTLAPKEDFIDQQRFLLSNGNYSLDISLYDINNPQKPLQVELPVEIDYPVSSVSVSGIQLIESFSKTIQENVKSKSGYDFVPYVDNFFPTDKSKLTFYAEVYNPLPADENNDKFLVSAYIESFESKNMLNDYVRIKREDAKPVIALFSEFDISKLPSGNYNLVVNVRNKQNKVLSQNATFFQRFNTNVAAATLDLASVNISSSFAQRYGNADTLKEHIKSLYPISTQLERMFIDNQLNASNLETMQQFFTNFWTTRNNVDPAGNWEKYRIEVLKVNNTYSTQVKKGYETDMGRVYLQYGPPDRISDVPYDAGGMLNSPSIPYQIWHYYTLNERERNKRFVFVASELMVKDYTLVHSEASGEIQNHNWQSQLTRNKSNDDMSVSPDDIKRRRDRSSTIYIND